MRIGRDLTKVDVGPVGAVGAGWWERADQRWCGRELAQKPTLAKWVPVCRYMRIDRYMTKVGEGRWERADRRWWGGVFA